MDSINNACKLGSDAWLELQAFKTRQLNRREKLNRHKNLHKDLINGIALNHQQLHSTSAQLASSQPAYQHPSTSPSLPGTSKIKSNQNDTLQNSLNTTTQECLNDRQTKHTTDSLSLVEDEGSSINNNEFSSKYQDYSVSKSMGDSTSNLATECISTNSDALESPLSINLDLVECLLLLKLCDVALKLPIDSKSLRISISKIRGFEATPLSLVENLLQKFAHQELITIDELTTAIINRSTHQNIGTTEGGFDETCCIYVTSADHTKLVEFDKSIGSIDGMRSLLLESKTEESGGDEYLSLSNSHTSVPIQTMRNPSSLTKAHKEDCRIVESRETTNQSIESTGSDRPNCTSSLNKLQIVSTIKASGKHSIDDLESLLLLSSTKERESKKLGEELLELLSKPTAKERNLLERFRSADGYQVQEFCPKGTKGECSRNNNGAGSCSKLHFKKIIAKHTEESLGDCSFLNTCFHMDSCKYVHYEVDYDDKPPKHQFKKPHISDHNVKYQESRESIALTRLASISNETITPTIKASIDDNTDSSKIKLLSLQPTRPSPLTGSVAKYTLSPEEQAQIDAKNRKRFKTVLYPPQWIQCDLRFFDMSLLGKFSVVMADPPWDIHMELPYGTMSDDEMRKLNIPGLQDEGVIFLWVTGRAMELGRECLALWGYERCDEIIWVKTNQLQRIIRTGRTGHWLNHGKEHCLVGVKGNPKDINRGLDCDVIVAEVRATSHKPDEIYGIIERLSPGTRKIELFGRAHNVQPNWITLGNQLNGVRLIEPNLVNAFKKLNLPFQTADHLA